MQPVAPIHMFSSFDVRPEKITTVDLGPEDSVCRSLGDVKPRRKREFSASQNNNRLARQAFVTASSQLVHPGRVKVKTAEGLTYDCFNPRGNVTVWSILKMFEGPRSWVFFGEPQTLGHHNFLHMKDLDRMLYAVSLKLTCAPELYDHAVDKQPVEVDSELVHVGNTSFKLRCAILLPQVNKPVAEKDFGIVFVDRETRRPSGPPVWWKELYSQYSHLNEGPLKVKPFNFSQVNETAQEEKVMVQSIDLDSYCHVNNASFVRFCYEAFIANHVRQFGYTGRGDPFRNVKTLACEFKGEAGLGDLLKILFVQDPQDRDMYHFKILNDSKSNVFECSLHFFPQIY